MEDKKLYRVEVSFSFYAYTENPNEAEEFIDEAFNDQKHGGLTAEVTQVESERDVFDYEEEELVYHDDDDRDITLEEAYQLSNGTDLNDDIAATRKIEPQNGSHKNL
jgi:hypothetical protein